RKLGTNSFRFLRLAKQNAGGMFCTGRTLLCVNPAYGEHSPVCVLGVDPALAGATGYGVVEKTERGWRMLRLGALRPQRNPRNATCVHLRQIHSLICDLIAEFQ